ncbi:MAG: hypothetical protein COB35_13465 [Gammaproteobacteria bacterium]|nr:MAG: hypothetical protein COB35_13465 [Gammaproteobacteria bacterium]
MSIGKKIINIFENILIIVFFFILFAGFYIGYSLNLTRYGFHGTATLQLFLGGGLGLVIATLFTGTLYLFLSIDKHLQELLDKLSTSKSVLPPKYIDLNKS